MARRRLCEDVNEGDAIPPFVVENLSRTDLVRYAGASGDFNPIHHDEGFARWAGNPTVFGHGMLTAGFVARCVTDFVGVAEPAHATRSASRRASGRATRSPASGKVTKRYEADGEGPHRRRGGGLEPEGRGRSLGHVHGGAAATFVKRSWTIS